MHTDADGDTLTVRDVVGERALVSGRGVYVKAKEAPDVARALLRISGSSARVVEPGAQPVAQANPSTDNVLDRHEALRIATTFGSFDSAEDLVAAAEVIRQYLSEGKK